LAKVEQSATATWPKPSHVSKKVGPKQKNLQGCFNFFFYRDENQNATKLQETPYLSLNPKVILQTQEVNCLIFLSIDD